MKKINSRILFGVLLAATFLAALRWVLPTNFSFGIYGNYPLVLLLGPIVFADISYGALLYEGANSLTVPIFVINMVLLFVFAFLLSQKSDDQNDGYINSSQFRWYLVSLLINLMNYIFCSLVAIG